MAFVFGDLSCRDTRAYVLTVENVRVSCHERMYRSDGYVCVTLGDVGNEIRQIRLSQFLSRGAALLLLFVYD